MGQNELYHRHQSMPPLSPKKNSRKKHEQIQKETSTQNLK